MYRRRLPHVYQTTHPVFLTWRLHNSLPAERTFPKATLTSGQAFALVDRLLDEARTGPTHLRRPELAQLVIAAILYNTETLKHYELHSYCVMPNHVHLLVTPVVPLPTLTKSLKTITAKRANELLNQTGHPFWAEETFDRTVRTPEEFPRIARYIENNPVKAGLAPSPDLYPWSSAWRAGPPARAEAPASA